MTDGLIRLPGDSTGKALDTRVVQSTVSTEVHREVMVVGDPLSTTGVATVTSSAGLVTSISSGTVLSTAATNPWSSAPGFNLPMVSASSGLVQISGTPTVTATGPVTITSGTVTLSSVHTVTATAASNPWSSAPAFNIPMVSASSGLIQISGTPLVNLVGTSSGIAPVTTSGGLGVTILAGAAGSTVVSLSSVHTVTATAATNPWSSAPSFDIPMVSASSGLVQISGTPLVNIVGTSSGVAVVTTSAGLYVWLAGIQSSGRVRFTTSVGSISTAPGVLHSVSVASTNIAGVTQFIRLYDFSTNNATSSSNSGTAGACWMMRISSSIAGMPSATTKDFVPGLRFETACSYDIVAVATSTAANAITGYVAAQYTSSNPA